MDCRLVFNAPPAPPAQWKEGRVLRGQSSSQKRKEETEAQLLQASRFIRYAESAPHGGHAQSVPNGKDGPGAARRPSQPFPSRRFSRRAKTKFGSQEVATGNCAPDNDDEDVPSVARGDRGRTRRNVFVVYQSADTLHRLWIPEAGESCVGGSGGM